MRKNIKAVLEAFAAGKVHSERTCHTNGTQVYSYAMLIAERGPDGKVHVVPYSSAPSATTRSQVRAVTSYFRDAVEDLKPHVPGGIITGNATMGSYGRY